MGDWPNDPRWVREVDEQLVYATLPGERPPGAGESLQGESNMFETHAVFGSGDIQGDSAGALPYLRQLGVTAILFESDLPLPTRRHKYDTRDYRDIDDDHFGVADSAAKLNRRNR